MICSLDHMSSQNIQGFVLIYEPMCFILVSYFSDFIFQRFLINLVELYDWNERGVPFVIQKEHICLSSSAHHSISVISVL